MKRVWAAIEKLINCIADVMFPPTCPFCGRVVEIGTTVCKDCRVDVIPHTLYGQGRGIYASQGRNIKNLDMVVAPFVYSGLVAKGVVSLKSDMRFGHANYFAPIIANALRELGVAEDIELVTFVPPHWTKAERALPERLAQLIAKELDKPFVPLLKKKRITRSQHKLSSKARKSNLSGAFTLKYSKMKSVGRFILICDDVTTSGSTLNECAGVLKNEGLALKVFGAVIAATPRRYRAKPRRRKIEFSAVSQSPFENQGQNA